MKGDNGVVIFGLTSLILEYTQMAKASCLVRRKGRKEGVWCGVVIDITLNAGREEGCTYGAIIRLIIACIILQ
jgi:tetrahydromethanopterin S-methyltransferase subunit G